MSDEKKKGLLDAPADGSASLKYERRKVEDGSFDPLAPLEIKLALFGEHKETINCGGAIMCAMQPQIENGEVKGISMLTSIMGVRDKTLLIGMFTSLTEHLAEVFQKLEAEDKMGSTSPPGEELSDKELKARMMMSRAAMSTTPN